MPEQQEQAGPGGNVAEGGPPCIRVRSAAGPQPCLLPALSSRSVKVAEWRRGHTKTPSGNNSEGRGRKIKPAFVFFFGASCPLAQGRACGGTQFRGTHLVLMAGCSRRSGERLL